MSTIVVVRKGDAGAIAADSLTTWGSARESSEYVINHRKIFNVGASYLAITGPTSVELAVKNYFGGNSGVDLHNVEAIFKAWIDLHTALRSKYFLSPMEERNQAVESSRVDVLIMNAKGVFGVSARRAVQEFSKYYAYGSGREYALGAMYAAYPRPDKSAEDIARTGIEAAAEFDVDTGLPIDLHSVRLDR